MKGDRAGKSPPTSSVSVAPVGGTTGKTSPAKKKPMEVSPSDDNTAARTVLPPKLLQRMPAPWRRRVRDRAKRRC